MSMRKIVLSLAATVMLAGTSYAANFNNLSFMGEYNEMHPVSANVYVPFFEKVKKDLNNDVTFSYFASKVLYPDTEAFAVLEDGRVDVAVVRPAAFVGRINLMSVVDIPGIVPNSYIGALLAADLLKKFPEIQEEFPKDSVSIAAWASAPLQFHSLKPINSIEDIKGMKVIVWNGVAMDLAQKLGANPVRIAATDSYLTLSKGMAEGIICPVAPFRSYKLSDVVKNHYIFNLGVVTFNLQASGFLWNDFPQEYKDYFMKEAQVMGYEASRELDATDARDLQRMKDNGDIVVEMSESDKEKVAAIFEELKSDWIKRMQDEGHNDADKILNYALERAEYYTAEYNKGTYSK